MPGSHLHGTASYDEIVKPRAHGGGLGSRSGPVRVVTGPRRDDQRRPGRPARFLHRGPPQVRRRGPGDGAPEAAGPGASRDKAPVLAMIRVVVVDDDFRIAGIHAAYVARVGRLRGHRPGAHGGPRRWKRWTGCVPTTAAAGTCNLPDEQRPWTWCGPAAPGGAPAGGRDRHHRRQGRGQRAARPMQGGALHYLLKPFSFPATAGQAAVLRPRCGPASTRCASPTSAMSNRVLRRAAGNRISWPARRAGRLTRWRARRAAASSPADRRCRPRRWRKMNRDEPGPRRSATISHLHEMGRLEISGLPLWQRRGGRSNRYRWEAGWLSADGAAALRRRLPADRPVWLPAGAHSIVLARGQAPDDSGYEPADGQTRPRMARDRGERSSLDLDALAVKRQVPAVQTSPRRDEHVALPVGCWRGAGNRLRAVHQVQAHSDDVARGPWPSWPAVHGEVPRLDGGLREKLDDAGRRRDGGNSARGRVPGRKPSPGYRNRQVRLPVQRAWLPRVRGGGGTCSAPVNPRTRNLSPPGGSRTFSMT